MDEILSHALAKFLTAIRMLNSFSFCSKSVPPKLVPIESVRRFFYSTIFLNLLHFDLVVAKYL